MLLSFLNFTVALPDELLRSRQRLLAARIEQIESGRLVLRCSKAAIGESMPSAYNCCLEVQSGCPLLADLRQSP